jgi:hypothetical protein
VGRFGTNHQEVLYSGIAFGDHDSLLGRTYLSDVTEVTGQLLVLEIVGTSPRVTARVGCWRAQVG